MMMMKKKKMSNNELKKIDTFFIYGS